MTSRVEAPPLGRARRAPAFFEDDVQIVARGRRVFLWREGTPTVRHHLALAEAVALAFLGATGTRRAAAEACSRALGVPLAVSMRFVERGRMRFAPYLRGRSARPVDLRLLRAAVAASRTTPAGPPPAPASVTWLVTLACPLNCVYCYFARERISTSTHARAPDALLPRPRALLLTQEMARVGAADLFLTGGEPLLRRDLTEIIAAASDAGVRAHLVTKYPIGASLARRLARARLHRLVFSLDDPRPDIAARVTGRADFATTASHAIRNCANSGLYVEVNTVVMDPDPDRLDAVANAAQTLGARSITYSGLRTTGATAAGMDSEMASLARGLAGRYPKLKISAAASDSTRATRVCESGWSGLHLLPDGTATRCRYLPRDRALHVGSVATQGLLQIWRGHRMARLEKPPRDRFRATRCASCPWFDNCAARGRCYASSIATSGTLFAPDAFCTRVP